MQTLYRLIAKASRSSHPVLILGESSTGKEMVAKAIHYTGPLGDRPFIPVDCGSLVPTLIESELFGYVKGAFTGASQSKDGLLAIADGGTIFLDEVGELPLDLQAKLLRTLQEKEIRPIGSTKQIPINVRILAVTNLDLEQAVAKGLFRQDLYFRLNVLSLRVPPLRERREDIPLLARNFLDHDSQLAGKAPEITDNAMEALLAYDWPGNVRELENCVERCCAMSSGPFIHPADLPSNIKGNSPSFTGSNDSSDDSMVIPIADLERKAILSTVARLNGDKMRAARMLGIGKTTLYRKLKEYAGQLNPAAEPVLRA
jgi:two-component system response regulator HydG